MAAQRQIFPEILMFFTFISQSIADRVSIPVPNGIFWGMTSLMGIFAKLSDSRWPPSSHFFPKLCCYLHKSPNVLHIEYPIQFQIGGFKSYGNICEVLTFKMATLWQFFPQISSKVLQIEYPFKFQIGGLSYDESYWDIRKVLRFKKATWQQFFLWNVVFRYIS